MLFDLRSAGRRRTVKTIYLTLAVLMAAGLILFGIGGAVSGGLLDAFSGSNGSGGGDSILQKQEKAAERRVRRNPQDAPAWATLARVRYQEAVQGDGYNQATGTFTAQGRAELAQVATAWDRYMGLDPAKPDTQTAQLMVQAFANLGKYDKAFDAQQIVVDGTKPPTAASYFQLAQYAYAAGNDRQGDLASQKTLKLTDDKAQRATLKAQLAAIKKQVSSAGAQSAAGGTGSATPTG